MQWLDFTAPLLCISDVAIQEIPVVKCCESWAYWRTHPDKCNFVILIKKISRNRLRKPWYLKHLMWSSRADAKLDFDLQIHNLLIRHYFCHGVLVMRLSIKPCESTVETKSKTDCWCLTFSPPPPPSSLPLFLSPTDREDQSILCTWVYRLSPPLHVLCPKLIA